MAESPFAPAVASPYAKSLQPVSLDTSLVESLRFAVPLWVHDLQGCTEEQLIARAKRCAQVVAEKGDALQFKGQSVAARQSTAHAFNRLAEGLACAAYQPGGVVFAGIHWCVGSRHMGANQGTSGPCDAEAQRAWDEATSPPRTRRPIVDVELPDLDAQGGVECA